MDRRNPAAARRSERVSRARCPERVDGGEPEFALGPAVSADGGRQLSKLLGHGGEYGELSDELSELLRRGQMDSDTPGLLEALTAVTVGQLAIDQPGYRYEDGAPQAWALPAPGADAT